MNNRERIRRLVAQRDRLECVVRDLSARVAALEHLRDDSTAQWLHYFGLDEPDDQQVGL